MTLLNLLSLPTVVTVSLRWHTTELVSVTKYSPTSPSGGRIRDEVSVMKEEFLEEMERVSRRPESRDVHAGNWGDEEEVEDKRRGKRQPTLESPERKERANCSEKEFSTVSDQEAKFSERRGRERNVGVIYLVHRSPAKVGY